MILTSPVHPYYAAHPHQREPRTSRHRVAVVVLTPGGLRQAREMRSLTTVEIPTYSRGLPGGEVEVRWSRVLVGVAP
jgi:hypothetical protein